MVVFLISVVVTAISLLIISKLPTGVEVVNPWIALIAGAIIGAFNSVWQLFPTWFRALNWVVSLGLIPLLGSIVVFGLSALLVEGFRLRWGIMSAILGAIALSIVNSILFFILRQTGLVAFQSKGSRQVLNAAALIYLAVAITSVMQLFYYISLMQRRQR